MWNTPSLSLSLSKRKVGVAGFFSLLLSSHFSWSFNHTAADRSTYFEPPRRECVNRDLGNAVRRIFFHFPRRIQPQIFFPPALSGVQPRHLTPLGHKKGVMENKIQKWPFEKFTTAMSMSWKKYMMCSVQCNIQLKCWNVQSLGAHGSAVTYTNLIDFFLFYISNVGDTI